MNRSENEAADAPKHGPVQRFFYGRRPGPLFYTWASILVIGFAVYYFDRTMPAFHDVVLPLYWMLATVGVVTTLRWFRWRTGNRRAKDRRRTERRSQRD